MGRGSAKPSAAANICGRGASDPRDFLYAALKPRCRRLARLAIEAHDAARHAPWGVTDFGPQMLERNVSQVLIGKFVRIEDDFDLLAAGLRAHCENAFVVGDLVRLARISVAHGCGMGAWGRRRT